MSDNTTAGGNQGPLLLYWLVVGIPLAWGVIETARNALKLFT
jgi:hypothetical protein